MATANVQIKKILVGRGNATISSNYAGVRGEVTMNTTTKALHVHDGVTTGGWPLATEFYVANLIASTGGVPGPQGNVGPQGAQGVQGNVGPQGLQGIQGNVGAQGIQGNTGAQGPQGIQGNVGATGTTGPQGIQGNVGATGSQGPQGIQGNTGATGAQGIQGNVGATGSQGPQGSPGIQGNVGAQGVQGNVGATGSQGIQGNIGPQGPQGIQGQQGNTGAQGISVTLVGNVATTGNLPLTGNAGDGYIVTTTGNLFFWNSNLSVWADIGPIVGPQGDAGPQGIQGNTGAQGSQGIQGNIGPQGPQGIQGNIGPQGPQGEQGIQGNIGPQGPQGIQGNVGATGAQGIQGIQGNTGATGPQGIQGNVGATGPQGPQGIQGNTGAQGSQGIQGNIGPQGIQGNTGPQGIQGNIGPQGPVGPAGSAANTGDFTFTHSNLASSTNANIRITTNGNAFVLGSNGNLFLPNNISFTSSPVMSTTGIVFGDGSYQNTAYTEAPVNQLINGVYAVNLDSVGNLTVPGDLVPSANVTYSLGNENYQWKDLWVSNNTIYIGNTPITVDGNTLLVNNRAVGGGSTGDLTISRDLITSIDGNTFINFDSDNELVLGTNTSSNVKIFVDDSNGGDLKTWTFGTDGNLTLPTNGNITFANGVNILSTVTGGGGNVSLPGLATSGTGTSNVAGNQVYALAINSESESDDEIALKVYAGGNNAGPAIAIGQDIGGSHRANVIAIGNFDVGYNSLPGGVYIGYGAGYNNVGQPQGLHSIAIGSKAAWDFATNNSITLNATGNELNPDESGLFIKPIRAEEYDDAILYYNPNSGEVTYANNTGVGAPVTVGNTASGTEGALWYNTEDGRTYVYALDTWIDASPAVVPGNMVGYGQDGNITLNEDARINYANGASIINSVYGDSQVADFLDDYTGNIAKIGATPLSIAAASVRLTSDNETWTFAPDGSLSFPDGSTQTTAYTGGAGGAGNALVNGGYTVALEANGVLTIGANATISNDGEFRLWATDTDITVYRNGQDGYGVKAGNIETFTDNALRTVTNSNGFEIKTGNLILSGDIGQPNRGVSNQPGTDLYITAGHTQGCSVPGGDTIISSGLGYNGVAHNGGNVTLRTGDYYSKQWTFDYDGALTLPGGGTIAEVGPGGAIQITPTGAASYYQALMIYPTAGAPEGDHIHLTAGGGTTELYLGDDNHYVKLVNGGNIELRAATANLSAQASWEFDTTGNIDARQALGIKVPNGVPTNVAVINSTTGSWEANPMSDLATTGGSGSGLTVNVTQTGGYASTIAIATAGTGYTNGDLITVTSGTSNATFTIVIGGRNTWQFDTTGSTTFPSNLTIQSNPFNTGTVISQANALISIAATGTAATYIGWSEFEYGPGNIALVAFNDDAGVVAIQTGATTGPEAFNEWIFDADGTLTFPTGGNLIFDSSATSMIDGVTSITANGNVTAAQYNFANGVNIFDTITGVTSINSSVSTLTISDASGDYTYGALDYDYAVNGASNSFSIQYSAPLAFGNVDINVGNVTATGTANVANLIISGTAPGTLTGSAGDTAGMIRVDSNYIYYCTSTFVPASWTVGWDGSTGNSLFIVKGAYPTPQVGWTVTQNIYTFTIDSVADNGSNWTLTYTGTAYGSPNGGTATLTNPNPATIWKSVPLNTFQTNVVTKATGTWNVTTGTNTYSFTVPTSGTYQLWVDCNIPNGILAYNATATVTNSDVPVVGQQFAWVYNGGGTPVDFASIPNQFVGTANTIVRSSVSPSATTNRFDFGINNTSGGNVTVTYGYVKIS